MSDTLTFSAPRLNASERLPYWVLNLWARWYDRLLALGADLPPRPEQ